VEDDAAYRVWLMDSVAPARWHDERPGRWVGEPSWPSPNLSERQFHFSGTDGNASLSNFSNTCELTVSTEQHCGLSSGEYFPFTYGPELPDNQLADDSLSTCIDSDTLESGLDILGAPALTLTLSCDKPLGFVVARLCDLHS